MWSGEKLTRYRKASGYSQKQLADMLGVSDASVSLWERNLVFPHLHTALELAKVLGVTIYDLQEGEEWSSAGTFTP